MSNRHVEDGMGFAGLAPISETYEEKRIRSLTSEAVLLRARLRQIARVCLDNAEPPTDARLALKFVLSIANQK